MMPYKDPLLPSGFKIEESIYSFPLQPATGKGSAHFKRVGILQQKLSVFIAFRTPGSCSLVPAGIFTAFAITLNILL